MKKNTVSKNGHNVFSRDSTPSHIMRFLQLLKEQKVKLFFREKDVYQSKGATANLSPPPQVIQVINNGIELRLKIYE
jgi:hypothetical protein